MISHRHWHPYTNIARLTMVSKTKGILKFYYFEGPRHKLENRQLLVGQGTGQWTSKQIRNNQRNSYLWTEKDANQWCNCSLSSVMLQIDYSEVIK